MSTIEQALSEQVLAALIAAPAHVAEKHAQRIEAEDFTRWSDRRIFEAFTHCEAPDHQEPGSVIVQINARLLAEGHYQGTDDGLRAAVIALAETRGHPEQLSALTKELVEARFRRSLAEHGAALAEHAATAPLDDVAERLRHTIEELRRLFARIPSQRNLRAVQDGGAA